MQIRQVLYGSLAVAAALGLMACGGGGSSDAGSAPQAADSSPAAANAAALTRAFAEFQRALPAEDIIDPAVLQKSLPPPDDTAEPTPVS